MKTDAKKRAAHAAVRSRIHGAVKKAVAAATTDQKDIALREAQSVIDTAARKGMSSSFFIATFHVPGKYTTLRIKFPACRNRHR